MLVLKFAVSKSSRFLGLITNNNRQVKELYIKDSVDRMVL